MARYRDPATPAEKAIWNERVKLTATALNNLGVAVMVSGVVVPVITLIYGTSKPQTRYWVAFALCCLFVGIGLHVVGRLYMRNIKA